MSNTLSKALQLHLLGLPSVWDSPMQNTISRDDADKYQKWLIKLPRVVYIKGNPIKLFDTLKERGLKQRGLDYIKHDIQALDLDLNLDVIYIFNIGFEGLVTYNSTKLLKGLIKRYYDEQKLVILVGEDLLPTINSRYSIKIPLHNSITLTPEDFDF